MTPAASPEARVRSVLAAARRLVDPGDPLGREARARLPGSTGLSPEGVELALAEHVETDVSEADLARLVASVASVAQAPVAHVILSANVFAAAVRALALGLAAAPRVVVKPSAREPVLPELLLRALVAGPLAGTVTTAPAVSPAPGDVVHAYGRDATLDAIRGALPAGVGFVGHGAGFGVAVLERARPALVAALVRDVIAFDQRGCLSPRVVLTLGDEADAIALGEALDVALADAATRVPVGAVEPAERAAVRAYLDASAMTGASFASVGVDVAPRALVLPPGPRVLHVARAASVEHALALLRPSAHAVTTLGGEGPLATALAAALPGARVAALGAMQRPPLDGPVDLRAPRPRP